MFTRSSWFLAAMFALVLGGTNACRRASAPTAAPGPEFSALMTRGNGLLEKGDAAGAIDVYRRALAVSPTSSDVRLNLANAYLVADRASDAARVARETLELDRNSAAASYLLGCALLRENRPEQAAAALQQSWKIAPGVPALDFQMGMAQQQLGQIPDAIRDFENVVRAVPDHPSAHFQLSQLYRRTGRNDDAARELAEHQRIRARAGATPTTVRALEECAYTQPLAPFVLAQPQRRGVAVTFVEDTATAFGTTATNLRSPLAVVDYEHNGRPSLLVPQADGALALLDNRAGHFELLGRPLRAPKTKYRQALVGDLDNDGFDDVVLLGEEGLRVVKFYAHGQMRDATRAAGLDGVRASGGLLADLDFTGNLDLAIVRPGGTGIGLYRNLGNFYFDPNWNDTGLTKDVPDATAVVTEDWTNEGVPGLFVARGGAAPLFFAKKRAGAFAASKVTDGWPMGSVFVTGDIDNDLHPEAIVATDLAIEFVDWKGAHRPSLPLAGFHVAGLHLLDFDNDGWLDVVAFGADGVRVWRNLGQAGFSDVTHELGLDRLGAVDDLVAADFDGDGDTDFVSTSENGARFWRNDGGNRNRQWKLGLTGNRSNASALGVRVEVVAGNWRTSRTVRSLPLEIGAGQNAKLDSVKVRWFDLATTQVDVPVGTGVYTIAEPTLPSGSCPYLYAWDGKSFRFVSDVLGAAPLGLPVSERHRVAADPEELLVLGDESRFPARNGAYEIRLTDELREVLYLDEARLIAVDHPPGTEVYPTSKMHAGPPFPAHELWTLRRLAGPRQATRDDGLDVTAALARIDNDMVAPVKLRRPQLRGLAEPYAVTLDFGPLPVDRPLVLALTGWIHFGGGMANISGSIDPTLPFPFPGLEVEVTDGRWEKVDVDVGTPAGKTKTILVDLARKLPVGAKRLRLSTAFELYWDCAELCERTSDTVSRFELTPTRTNLHARGYSRYADLPAALPLTPEYANVRSTPPWDRTPSGWFTRYGAVDELVTERDDRLALVAAGDELAISFDAKLPPPAAGMKRDFFLHLVGWDKDADFHVVEGWRLEPFPYRGMDDQAYGHESRPARLDDGWIKQYNTRWVAPEVVSPVGKMTNVP